MTEETNEIQTLKAQGFDLIKRAELLEIEKRACIQQLQDINIRIEQLVQANG